MITRSALARPKSTCNPKARCNGDGTSKFAGFGWSGVAITSSEDPILNHAVAHGGLKVRVLQTEGIQWTSNADDAELISSTVLENYGFGGKEFGEYVSQIPFDELCERYEASREVVDELMMVKQQLDELAEREKELKKQVLTAMQSVGEDTWSNDLIQFSRKAAYERESIDTKALKANEPSIYESYKKTTKVAESISYKLL